MKVNVLFFGVLSDVSGTGIKCYEDVKSVEHLRQKVSDEFPEIIHYNFKLSLNNEFIEDDCPLNEGDEVAFLPPFAGG